MVMIGTKPGNAKLEGMIKLKEGRWGNENRNIRDISVFKYVTYSRYDMQSS